MRGGSNQTAPVQISDVISPISNLCSYIQRADLESAADLQKLNTIAEQINSLTQEEQRLFSGALELECTGNLDDALRIAECLERYEIFPKIKTDADLGRFLVETSTITGKFSFPESARPYLDYAKIGAEQRGTLGGVYTPYGLVKCREEAPVQTETPSTMLMTLTASERSYAELLPILRETGVDAATISTPTVAATFDKMIHHLTYMLMIWGVQAVVLLIGLFCLILFGARLYCDNYRDRIACRLIEGHSLLSCIHGHLLLTVLYYGAVAAGLLLLKLAIELDYNILLGAFLSELLITLLACGSVARKNLYQIVKGAEA